MKSTNRSIFVTRADPASGSFLLPGFLSLSCLSVSTSVVFLAQRPKHEVNVKSMVFLLHFCSAFDRHSQLFLGANRNGAQPNLMYQSTMHCWFPFSRILFGYHLHQHLVEDLFPKIGCLSYCLGGYFFKWRTVLYFFLQTGKRYQPNSFLL